MLRKKSLSSDMLTKLESTEETTKSASVLKGSAPSKVGLHYGDVDLIVRGENSFMVDLHGDVDLHITKKTLKINLALHDTLESQFNDRHEKAKKATAGSALHPDLTSHFGSLDLYATLNYSNMNVELTGPVNYHTHANAEVRIHTAHPEISINLASCKSGLFGGADEKKVDDHVPEFVSLKAKM